MTELSDRTRRLLNAERRALVRWVGARYEQLVLEGIDPAPWVQSVVATFPPKSAAESGYTSTTRARRHDAAA